MIPGFCLGQIVLDVPQSQGHILLPYSKQGISQVGPSPAVAQVVSIFPDNVKAEAVDSLPCISWILIHQHIIDMLPLIVDNAASVYTFVCVIFQVPDGRDYLLKAVAEVYFVS